jgi:hypothetical protein
MGNLQPQPQRTILTEDGELRDAADAPELESSTIYCTRCGAANRADSRFCRKCGQSLDEQAVNPASLDDYQPPEQKNKRSVGRALSAQALRSASPMSFGLFALEIITMIVVVALTIYFASINLAGVALGVLIAWACIAAARHSSQG